MSEKPSFLDDLQHEKPESFGEEVFTKRQRNFYPMIIGGTAVTLVILFIIILLNLGVKAPDMTGWTEGEVFNWGKDNGITIIKALVYSEDIDTNILISQGIEIDKRVRKSTPFPVTISQGPDPNAPVAMIDIKATNEDNIKAWIDDNKLTGVTLRYETNEVVPKGTVIEYTVVDGTESNFLRKNRVNIFISSGPEIISDTVTVPNFTGNQKSVVVQWANKNDIEIIYTEVFDEFVELGQVVSQSITADTKITREDSVEIVLSLGKPIEVPDFYGMTRLDAAELATRYGITLYYEQIIYAGEADKVLDQDIIGGSQIAKNQPVTLTISRESDEIKVPQFVGLTQSEATTLAGLNNIRVFAVTVESTEKSDMVISQDISAGQMVLNTGYVTLEISSGQLIIPDLTVLSLEEAELWASKNQVTLTVFERYHDSQPYGKLYDQSLVGAHLLDTNSLVIYRSLGKIPVGDFIKKTRLDVEEWLNQVNTQGGNIVINYKEVANSQESPNTVVNQSKKLELVNVSTTIDIYVAKAKSIVVPKFGDMTKTEATTWGLTNNVPVNILDRYSSTKAAGTLYNQSVVGTLPSILDGVTIYHSIGLVVVPDFTGQDKSIVEDWVESANANGASLTATYKTTASTVYKVNQVSAQTSKSTSIALNSSVTFYVVSNFYNPTPDTEPEEPEVRTVVTLKDFTGVSLGAFENWCDENGIDINKHVVIKSGHHDTLTGDPSDPMNTTNLMYGQNLYGNMTLETQTLEIYKSIGRVDTDAGALINDTVSIFKGAFNTWNMNNAKLTVTYQLDGGGNLPSSYDDYIVKSIAGKNDAPEINTGDAFIVTIAPAP